MGVVRLIGWNREVGETGTRPLAGPGDWRLVVQGGTRPAPDDLEAVFEAAPEVLVVGQGAYGLMRVRQETRQALQAANTKVAGSEPRIGG